MSFVIVKYGQQKKIFNTQCQVAMLLDAIINQSTADIVKTLKKRHEDISKERNAIQNKKNIAEQKIKLCEEYATTHSESEPTEDKKKPEKKETKKKEEKKTEAKKDEKKAEVKKDAKEPEEEAKEIKDTKKEAKKESKKKEDKKEAKKKEEKKVAAIKKEEPEEIVVSLTDEEKEQIGKTKEDCVEEIKKLSALEDVLKAKGEKVNILKEKYTSKEWSELTVIDLQDSEGERKFLCTKKMECAKEYLTEKAEFDLVQITTSEGEETATKIMIDESIFSNEDSPKEEEGDLKKKQAKAKVKK